MQTVDDSIRTIIKDSFGTDLLGTNSNVMSLLRVAIIKDRNYSVPEWFLKYITPDDVLSLINSLLRYDNHIPDKAKHFIHQEDMRGNIKNYKEIVRIMVESDNYELTGYLNPDKMYRHLKRYCKNELDSDKVADIIWLSDKIRGYVPQCFIYLYLRSALPKRPLWMSPRQDIDAALEGLLLHVPHGTRDSIYAAIYNANLTKDDAVGVMSYTNLIAHFGGTWLKPIHGNDMSEIHSYVTHYNGSWAIDDMKPMHDNIAKYLKRYKEQLIALGDTKTLNKFIECLMRTVNINMDNANFVSLVLDTADDYNRLGIVLMRAMQSKPHPGKLTRISNQADKWIEKLSPNVIEPLLNNFIKHAPAENIDGILPYIHRVAQHEQIHSFINMIAPRKLAKLLDINPVVYSGTEMTLIDVIVRNKDSFSIDALNTIKAAFALSENAINMINPIERYALFFRGANYQSVCATYPPLVRCIYELRLSDVASIYKMGTDVIHHVYPQLIPTNILLGHMRANGYTELYHIDTYGLERVLTIHQLVSIITETNGCIGHLLDFSHMEYRNAIIRILHDRDYSYTRQL